MTDSLDTFKGELLSIINKHKDIGDGVKTALARHLVCGAGLALCHEKNPANIRLAAYSAGLAAAIDALGWKALLPTSDGGANICLMECDSEEEAETIIQAFKDRGEGGLNG